jgi:hypothetical protein
VAKAVTRRDGLFAASRQVAAPPVKVVAYFGVTFTHLQWCCNYTRDALLKFVKSVLRGYWRGGLSTYPFAIYASERGTFSAPVDGGVNQSTL